ncbi:PilW family protein [Marinicella gelatinilytica]|uniref:PilW family protein n=1 Tax=Marinicella gelatinilytica TaxID=2996017 RepID=UPI002260D415|nr:prepilin-type N-terminal cleavage/methylation domain-containing protein [Marinicella gelatinilytica]MCX7544583.1 prepilin-type N-terminal cleavage/methylation domain-containing protein [Marinicella gelatinilytica]
MNKINKPNNMRKYSYGFSLIELMVAMVIGIIVLLGLVSLFTNSSILNRAQTGLAVLQENGRYAITRVKDDIEQAGRKHCATVAMPSDLITNWNQGYVMRSWMVDENVDFSNHSSTNGLPLVNQIELNYQSDPNQLPNATASVAGQPAYPLDPRYFIQGHTCGASTCQPGLTTVGSDQATNFRNIGTGDGDRAANTDILTVRYLDGGNRIINDPTANSFTLDNMVISAGTNPTLVSDCNTAYVSNGNWAGNSLTMNGTNVPNFNLKTDTRAFDLTNDFHTVSYFVGIDSDPNRSGRMISSLYRSENGNVQQLVQGVERFNVFYLAQLQTGHVARLTADQVQAIQDGGNATIDGCIIPPNSEALPGGVRLANGQGCLWRSIYAMEVHMLLNTVNDSSMKQDETYIYSPDSDARQTPASTLPSGLSRDRMYRREFTAIIPIRSYTL